MRCSERAADQYRASPKTVARIAHKGRDQRVGPLENGSHHAQLKRSDLQIFLEQRKNEKDIVAVDIEYEIVTPEQDQNKPLLKMSRLWRSGPTFSWWFGKKCETASLEACPHCRH